MQEITAQIVDGVDPDRRQPELEARHEVALEVGVEGADLLRVDLADEGDGLEVLQTERGELEQLQGHEGHDDVHAVEADVRRRRLVRLRVGLCDLGWESMVSTSDDRKASCSTLAFSFMLPR